MRNLADALPEGVFLILDEAYHEFVSDPAYHGSHELALERRTWSACARSPRRTGSLARVGYGIATERVADYVERSGSPSP